MFPRGRGVARGRAFGAPPPGSPGGGEPEQEGSVRGLPASPTGETDTESVYTVRTEGVSVYESDAEAAKRRGQLEEEVKGATADVGKLSVGAPGRGRGRGRGAPTKDDEEEEEIGVAAAPVAPLRRAAEIVPPVPGPGEQFQEDAESVLSVPTTTSGSDTAGRNPSITTTAVSSHWSGPKTAERRLPPPPPPKIVRRGEKGDIVSLATNYLRLEFSVKGASIYEYHVDFIPDVDSTKMRRQLLGAFFQGKPYVFDGTMLFVPEKNNGDILTFETTHPLTQERMKIVGKFIKEKGTDDLVLFFNITFKKIMRILGRIQHKRNYYNISGVVDLNQHNLEIWPGVCVAVEQREDGIMLSLDTSHRVLRKETVYQLMMQIKQSSRGDWKAEFMEQVLGGTVLTRYNNAFYKVDDISWDASPNDTFDRKGHQITYKEYYSAMHNLQIQHDDQPLLINRMKPRRNDPDQTEKIICLIPELCFLTGLTESQRSNFTLMKDMGDHTRLTPAQRKANLETFIKDIHSNEEARHILEEWNLKLAEAPIHLDGRVMSAPKLDFGRNRQVVVGPDFTRDAMASVINPVDLQRYLVICHTRDADKASKFQETYHSFARSIGIKTTAAPLIVPIKGQSVNDFARAIKDNLKASDFQFLLTIMPQQREDVYSCIKTMCLHELEIPTQCVLSKTLANEKRFKSVVQKITLQINCKLGGALWGLNVPVGKPTMLVGIDIAHDPRKKQPSILGLVASLNNQCTRYLSLTRTMKKGQEERSDILTSAFEEALETFAKTQGGYPERIIVWRDGGLADPMSFNQHEVGQVKKAVEEKCCQAVELSYIVVQKRIPQRFFKTDRMGKHWSNPDPGTVVDHTVTTYSTYDFYLTCQMVRQGTVTPTHYTVIYESKGTKPDLLQKYTYALSYMYYNWTGPVRVPAPTQYAHKLAGLIISNVRGAPGPSLKETLYYL